MAIHAIIDGFRYDPHYYTVDRQDDPLVLACGASNWVSGRSTSETRNTSARSPTETRPRRPEGK